METLSPKKIEKEPRISRQEFETLLQPNERLYRTALIMTKSPNPAKELVDQTHLTAWRGYAKVGRYSNFGSWLSGLLGRRFCSLNGTSVTKLNRGDVSKVYQRT